MFRTAQLDSVSAGGHAPTSLRLKVSRSYRNADNAMAGGRGRTDTFVCWFGGRGEPPMLGLPQTTGDGISREESAGGPILRGRAATLLCRWCIREVQP